jgi:hypothetical protein
MPVIHQAGPDTLPSSQGEFAQNPNQFLCTRGDSSRFRGLVSQEGLEVSFDLLLYRIQASQEFVHTHRDLTNLKIRTLLEN